MPPRWPDIGNWRTNILLTTGAPPPLPPPSIINIATPSARFIQRLSQNRIGTQPAHSSTRTQRSNVKVRPPSSRTDRRDIKYKCPLKSPSPTCPYERFSRRPRVSPVSPRRLVRRRRRPYYVATGRRVQDDRRRRFRDTGHSGGSTDATLHCNSSHENGTENGRSSKQKPRRFVSARAVPVVPFLFSSLWKRSALRLVSVRDRTDRSAA